MSAAAGRARLVIAAVAVAVLAGLLVLKRAELDETLLSILAVAGALLVTLLFVTYRALRSVVEAAASQPPPADSGPKDDT